VAKIGRNQPCPCGSGKKYKRCCREKDQNVRVDVVHEMLSFDALSGIDDLYAINDLDRLSNSVIDLVNEGRLDEADAVCEQLRTEYPEVHDWMTRKAMICEARGEYELAMEYCQRVIDWMDANPEDFEPRSREPFYRDIERLKILVEESG
jgi:tetratricopeptide (TPR) repeat protein